MPNHDFPRTVAIARHNADQAAYWYCHCLRAFMQNEVTAQLIENPDELDIDMILVMGAKALIDMLAGGSCATEAEEILSSIETGE